MKRESGVLKLERPLNAGHLRSAVLCQVKGSYAYFTTRKLNEQTGHDWQRQPRFAGLPQYPVPHETEHFYENGRPKWRIIKVWWSGPFVVPAQYVRHNVSVARINKWLLPWLKSYPIGLPEGEAPPCALVAGTKLSKFLDIVRSSRGNAIITDASEIMLHHVGACCADF